MKNNNIFTVETIVNKYVETVEHLNKDKFAHYTSTNFPYFSMDLPANIDKVQAPHQQLLSKLWSIVNEYKTNINIFNEISSFIDCYNNKILSQEEILFLTQNYKNTVNYIFSLKWNWAKNSSNNNNTNKIITELLNCKVGDNIYIPVINEYKYLATYLSKCNIYGNMTNPEDWAFCYILFDANNICFNIPYPNLDYFEILDNISTHITHITNRNTIDYIIIDDFLFDLVDSSTLPKVYEILKTKSNIIAMVDSMFLGSMKDSILSFRKQIIKDKTFKSIIQISHDSFIIYINKNKNDNVAIIDTTIISPESNIVPSIKDIINMYNETNTNTEIYRYFSYKQIDAEILLPKHYLIYKPQLSTDLSKILKVASFENPTKDTIPAVILKDLSSSFDKASLSIEELSPIHEYGNKEHFVIIKNPCIFFCSNTEDTRIAYISNIPETGIAVSKSINCFETIDTDLTTATLLLLEDYVSQQIKAIGIWRRVRKIDDTILSKIKILPLTYDEKYIDNISIKSNLEQFKKEIALQKDRIQKKLYETIERQKQEKSIQYEDYQKSIRLRKHALTQSLSSFDAMFKVLMNCRRKQNGFLEDNDLVSKINKVTVADAFTYLENSIKSIQQKLAAIADIEEDFGRSQFIDPVEFINSYIESNKSGWINFTPIIGWDKLLETNRALGNIADPKNKNIIIKKGDILNTLHFPQKALEKIFDNIISNAIAHGFLDKFHEKYKIRFSWEASGMDIKIIIENNGLPIHKDINTTDILEYGFSTSLNTNGHNGIGGSEIATIMRKYDGDVQIISTPNEQYTVKYILTFKRINKLFSF